MKRILIVDNQQDVTDGLAELLTDAGHQLAVAYTGLQCQVLLKNEAPFDLILLDLQLPDISGLDLFKLITVGSPSSRVMLLSAYRLEHIFSLFFVSEELETIPNPITQTSIAHLSKTIKNNFFAITEANDDNTAHQIAYALSENGLCSQIVRNEDQFHSTNNQIKPDILIFDQTLPTLSIIKCCLHAKLMHKNVPIIIVKPIHDQTNDILYKPFQIEKIFDAINHHDIKAKQAPKSAHQ